MGWTISNPKAPPKTMLGMVTLSNFEVPAASTVDITGALTEALASLPLQIGAQPGGDNPNGVEGVAAPPFNTAMVYFSEPTREPAVVEDDSVYARITFENGKYMLSFFSAPEAVEAPFEWPAPAHIDVDIPYWSMV